MNLEAGEKDKERRVKPHRDVQGIFLSLLHLSTSAPQDANAVKPRGGKKGEGKKERMKKDERGRENRKFR